MVILANQGSFNNGNYCLNDADYSKFQYKVSFSDGITKSYSYSDLYNNDLGPIEIKYVGDGKQPVIITYMNSKKVQVILMFLHFYLGALV